MTCDWPSTTDVVRRAWSVSGVGETGTTWPRTARIRFISRTPSSKSPSSTAVIAAISRFPRAWPASPWRRRPSPLREAVLEDPLINGSASASATMQLRMSPTGGIPSSSRRTPDEPPSSATVTIAVRLLVCSFSPRSSADRPVPPPIATMRGPRARKRFW